MLINVVDSASITQKLIVTGQEAVIDHSGSIASTGVAQDVVAANVNRSGFFFMNTSANVMHLNELGAATTSSIPVAAGASFPPAGYPVTTGAWSVIGTAADTYIAREW